jgi:hypothetical protein
MKSSNLAVKMVFAVMTVLCSPSKGASAQISAPSAPAPLTMGERFRLYLRQSYSTPSMLVPVGLAAIDQATDSPKEWGEGGQGYLNRLGTRRGQLQIGNFCAFSVDAVLHEDPRFVGSGLHGMWRRTAYVLAHTVAARTESRREEPAFENFAGALGSAFFPSFWLPRSENSAGDSLNRSAMFLGMQTGVNMGIEFGPDDRRFFHEKILRMFHQH